MTWDPARLIRERTDVGGFAPGLRFIPAGEAEVDHGGWRGALPLWPFERPEPPGLRTIIPTPCEVIIAYSAAHPVIAPKVYSINPVPDFEMVSTTDWHVLPHGALCLLQSDALWVPESSTTELLLKACGWRIEYALMRLGVVDKMTTNGIVESDELDKLITQAARQEQHGVADG